MVKIIVDENINLKKVKVLIARATLNDSVLMECEVKKSFSDFQLASFKLAVFKEIERGYYFLVYISVYDTEDRLICGDTCDLRKIENSHFRLQALTSKMNEVIAEAKKIIKE